MANDLFQNIGKRKVKLFEDGQWTSESESSEEIKKKRNSYLKYNRGEGKTEEKEIPSWDKQTFKK